MCTRFFVNEEVLQKAYILSEIQTPSVALMCSGDIHPSQHAIILARQNDHIFADTLSWGFPRSDTKSLIVNARSETIHEKRMFQDSAIHRRCVIPAAGFYEWDPQKNIATFTSRQAPVLFLAGIHQSNRFAVLTTNANDSVRPVHPRMPVLIAENSIHDWLFDSQYYRELLNMPMPALSCLRENEQLSLF